MVWAQERQLYHEGNCETPVTWLDRKVEIAPFHPSRSAPAYAGDRHTPTPTASACSCHTTGTAAGREHTRPPHQQTQPAAGIACGCPSLPGPAASRAPAHAPQRSLPTSAGPRESCSVLVLVAKTSSSPRCCVWGGKIRLQPPAQMCPGTKFTPGLAPDSAVVFGGTGKSLLSTTYYKHLPCCSFFSREIELSLATSDVGSVPVGAPSHSPPE